MDATTELERLWKHRGGLIGAYRRLTAYASKCIDLRSTARPGGRQVAQLKPEEVVDEAIFAALADADCPGDGEELYRLVRRKIDNGLHTLEKSPKVIGATSLNKSGGARIAVGDDIFADAIAGDPAAGIVGDEEEELHRQVIEETRRRLKSPNCLEAQLLSLIVEGAGDKAKLCATLKIDGTKFDRLKSALKAVAQGATADFTKGAKR